MEMRLLSGVIVLLLASGTSAFAQTRNWGAKGGLNMATLSSDDKASPDFKFRFGLVAGGFYTLPIGERFEVQPEALFSQQGAALDEQGVSAKIKVDYLTVPILARYRFAPRGHGLVVYGGPSIGFKVSAKATANFGSEDIKTDISDDIETVDVGVAAGAAYESGRMSLEGRYTFGLSDIGKGPEEPSKTKHRVIGILVGVRF
jgi:hypothetical protein